MAALANTPADSWQPVPTGPHLAKKGYLRAASYRRTVLVIGRFYRRRPRRMAGK